MNNVESLFGFISSRFSAHPENIATESLNYILNKSSLTKSMFVNIFSNFGIELNNELNFTTQVIGIEGEIPDIIGKCSNSNDEIFVIEAKFWAGLQDSQPVTYFNRLPKNKPSALIFISPAMRFNTLWKELMDRCALSGICFDDHVLRDDYKYAKHGNNKIILTSWRYIINNLINGIGESDGTLARQDLIQLQGLCDKMDVESFIPVNCVELNSHNATRITQFCKIIDDLSCLITSNDSFNAQYTSKSSGGHTYWRPMIINGYGCYLSFNPPLWSKRRETPIWLKIHEIDANGNWLTTESLCQKLGRIPSDYPFHYEKYFDECYVSLRIACNEEEGQVLANLSTQLSILFSLLK